MLPSKLRITKAAKKRGKQATAKMTKIRTAALAKHKVNGLSIAKLEKMSADRALNERQLLFVRNWASGETPRTAMALAGYAETSVGLMWKLTRDPAILKLYNAEKKLYEEAEGHTKKRVMSMLQEAYDCAKLVSEPASMVAAARELGKMAGHYEPETRNVNINVGGKLFDRMSAMSDDQLLKILESHGEEIIGEAMRVVDADEVPSLPAPR